MISISTNKSRVIALAAIFGLVALTSAGHASTLIGSEIEARYEFPVVGDEYGPPPVSFLVGDGDETVINIEDVTWLNIDFSASSLLITLNTVLLNPRWSGPPISLQLRKMARCSKWYLPQRFHQLPASWLRRDL